MLDSEGSAADEAMLKIVGGTSPGRGLSRTAHLGLAGILWVPQGSLHLTDKPEWDEELLAGLAMPSSVIQGSKEREIQKQLDLRLSEYLTPTGHVKSDSPISRIQKEIEDLGPQIAEVSNATQKLESLSQQAQKDEENQGIIEAESAELDERLKKARNKMDEVTDGIQEMQKQEKKVEDLIRMSETLKQKIDRFGTLGNEINSMSKKRDEIKESISDKEIEINSIEKKMSYLNEELRSLKAQEKDKNVDIDRASAQEKLKEKEEQLRETEEVLSEVEEIKSRIEKLKQEIETLNVPGEESVEEIRSLREKISDIELQIRSSGLRLEFKPKKVCQRQCCA